MASLWTWNVGMVQSEFHARGSAMRSKIVMLTTLLDQHKPSVLFMQEWGLHEQGVPPDELRQVLPRLVEYTAVIDGSYVTMIKADEWECKSHSWTKLDLPSRDRWAQVHILMHTMA